MTRAVREVVSRGINDGEGVTNTPRSRDASRGRADARQGSHRVKPIAAWPAIAAAAMPEGSARRPTTLRLLCILAHPDDESIGLGGILAKYGAGGIETYLVTATRGERGWSGPSEENPGPTALGQIREQELRDAASVLGIREMVHDGRAALRARITNFRTRAEDLEVIVRASAQIGAELARPFPAHEKSL